MSQEALGLPIVRGRAACAELLGELHAKKQRIVFVNGCFDLLHPGHVQVFFEARRYGSALIVAMNSDASITQLKGAERPILAQSVRETMVASLQPVSGVFCFDERDASEALRFVRPQVYAKGAQYRGRPYPESSAVAELGIEVVYLSHVDGFSTSELVASIRAGRRAFGG
jgi:rfaE bifunctional protein nucleotidyltransferase chain/domain